jgi:carbon-monoxide dehydrogenase medium subunit
MALEFFEPEVMDEALELGERFGEGASFLAGGTDLVIQMHRGKRQPRQLVSLLRLPELDRIDARGPRITLGGLVTHRSIERHARFQGCLRALVESAEVVGGHQVRNVGTVGGNLCNASPAADLLPILLALEADVHLRSAREARTLPLSSFLQGPGRTARLPGELLVAVSFDALKPRSATAFLKIGRRRAMEISIVSAGAMVRLDDEGRCVEARIAIGAAAPTAIRLPEAESVLRGRALEASALAQAGKAAGKACSPLSDVRASSAYRRRLVETLVARAVAKAAERARGENS